MPKTDWHHQLVWQFGDALSHFRFHFLKDPLDSKNLLIVLSDMEDSLLNDFCGPVLSLSDLTGLPTLASTAVYLCDNLLQSRSPQS